MKLGTVFKINKHKFETVVGEYLYIYVYIYI